MVDLASYCFLFFIYKKTFQKSDVLYMFGSDSYTNILILNTFSRKQLLFHAHALTLNSMATVKLTKSSL